jgi:mycofactocin biosynthesis protein MftB
MAFDPDSPWQVADTVAVREEPFGALAYDYTTRRLSFLRSPRLAAIVASLDTHPSARAACDAAGVDSRELPQFLRALGDLAARRIITRRTR